MIETGILQKVSNGQLLFEFAASYKKAFFVMNHESGIAILGEKSQSQTKTRQGNFLNKNIASMPIWFII